MTANPMKRDLTVSDAMGLHNDIARLNTKFICNILGGEDTMCQLLDKNAAALQKLEVA